MNKAPINMKVAAGLINAIVGALPFAILFLNGNHRSSWLTPLAISVAVAQSILYFKTCASLGFLLTGLVVRSVSGERPAPRQLLLRLLPFWLIFIGTVLKQSAGLSFANTVGASAAQLGFIFLFASSIALFFSDRSLLDRLSATYVTVYHHIRII